jgi:hypothetical protein
LQGDVLQLYRAILRAARQKDTETLAFARERFRESASAVKRSEFKRIEFLLRQGHKRLKLLSMPGVTSAGSLVGADGGHASNPAARPSSSPPKRSFSTTAAAALATSPNWNVWEGPPRRHDGVVREVAEEEEEEAEGVAMLGSPILQAGCDGLTTTPAPLLPLALWERRRTGYFVCEEDRSLPPASFVN